MNKEIIFFGSGPYVIPVIETLNRSFDIVSVITTETSGKIFNFCKSENIKCISVSSSPELIKNKSSIINARVAVLASFGLIIPNELLNGFELGIINIHPSLLPTYRGPTPVQTAILNGDRESGVSIIKLDQEVDHGPILAQEKVKIELDDTAESLYVKLFKQGAEILTNALPEYLSGELRLTEQNHSDATFTKPLTRASGEIKLNDPPDKTYLDRLIRAYYPWPGVWFRTNLNGKKKTIKLLPSNRIQVEGKNVMNLKDFANGYPEGNAILSTLNLNE